MRAVVIHEQGGLDSMVLDAAYRDPACRPGDAIVRVRACSLNYHDVFTRKGMPGIRVPMPIVIGIDVAGDVVEVGNEVSGFATGDRVLIDPIDRVDGGLLGETFDGGLAELVWVPAHMLIKLNGRVSYAAAAALPVAYGTASRMMVTRGEVKAGETVVILGASGAASARAACS